jgi:hypothetical protein
VTAFPLAAANEALARLRAGAISDAAVLTMAGSGGQAPSANLPVVPSAGGSLFAACSFRSPMARAMRRRPS